MKRPVLLPVVLALAALGGMRSTAAQLEIPGSTAFCLYELPADPTGGRRWINLGIVQYVEASAAELKISYGGGAFGSGHEARIAVSGIDDALLILEKMRRVAAACR